MLMMCAFNAGVEVYQHRLCGKKNRSLVFLMMLVDVSAVRFFRSSPDTFQFFSCAHFYLGAQMCVCIFFAECESDSARKMNVYFIKVLHFNVKKLITFLGCQRKFRPYTCESVCVSVYEFALFAFNPVHNWILCWFSGWKNQTMPTNTNAHFFPVSNFASLSKFAPNFFASATFI